MRFFFIETPTNVYPVVADSLGTAQLEVVKVDGTAVAQQNPLFGGIAFTTAEAEATGFLG